MSRKEVEAPPLPAKKQHDDKDSTGGRILNAQKLREQELSEKEKGQKFFEEKQEMLKKGLITNDELYTIDTRDELLKKTEARKRFGDHDEQLLELLQLGVINQQDLIDNGVRNKPNVDPITTQPRSRDVNPFSPEHNTKEVKNIYYFTLIYRHEVGFEITDRQTTVTLCG